MSPRNRSPSPTQQHSSLISTKQTCLRSIQHSPSDQHLGASKLWLSIVRREPQRRHHLLSRLSHPENGQPASISQTQMSPPTPVQKPESPHIHLSFQFQASTERRTSRHQHPRRILLPSMNWIQLGGHSIPDLQQIQETKVCHSLRCLHQLA